MEIEEKMNGIIKETQADQVKLGVQMFNLAAGGDWAKAKSQEDITRMLEALAAAGYDGVEWCDFLLNAETPEGMPEPMRPDLARIRADMDRLGLETCALHYHFRAKDPEGSVQAAVQRCLALGSDKLIFAFSTPEMFGEKPDEKGQYTAEQIDRWAERVNEILRVMKQAVQGTGIRVLYHNHAPEFLQGTDGRRAFDLFEADGKEVDVYWASKGLGGSVDAALDYVEAHAAQTEMLHVKDGLAGSAHTGEMCGWGKGTFDLQKIIDKAKAHKNIGWVIVENDNPGSFHLSGLEDSIQSAEYARAKLDFTYLR